MLGRRRAIRRRAPLLKPGSHRRTMWSRSWWSRRNERGARHPCHLQRLPRGTRGGIRGVVPERALDRAVVRAGVLVWTPPPRDFGFVRLFQFLSGRDARRADLK